MPTMHRNFAELVSEMPGLVEQVKDEDWRREAFPKRASPFRLFLRSAHAGGGSAGLRQLQGCEPGSHFGFAGSHPCNWFASVPILNFDLKDEGFALHMDKRSLTKRDICTKFILPAVNRAGWDEMLQIREEVYFTKGRIIVRGKAKKTDVVLYYKPNIPIALIEAKDKKHSVGDGMQQRLDYASILDIPFVFSSKSTLSSSRSMN